MRDLGIDSAVMRAYVAPTALSSSVVSCCAAHCGLQRGYSACLTAE